ncbi:MAG: CoA ester lyase [Sphingomonas bacterium]
MIPIRSFLFVPGNKESWIEKATASGADALILDLEDSVPHPRKVEARGIVAGKIAWLAGHGQRVWVRINRSPHLYDYEDVMAVAREGLEGIVISKPVGPEDIDCISMMLSEAEARNGLPMGGIKVVPLLETARALQFAYEIASRPRVTGIVGATAKNADVARSLGYVWTPEGRETLFLKSQAVMAARAAGKLPIGGVWQQIKDIDGCRKAAEDDRQLGMSGQLVLHPSNVEVVNQAFCPTPEDVEYYKGMVAALDVAKAQGRASVVYDGEHIDIAHVKTAEQILELARAYGLE